MRISPVVLTPRNIFDTLDCSRKDKILFACRINRSAVSFSVRFLISSHENKKHDKRQYKMYYPFIVL